MPVVGGAAECVARADVDVVFCCRTVCQEEVRSKQGGHDLQVMSQQDRLEQVMHDT
jgi:hypothetical protein